MTPHLTPKPKRRAPFILALAAGCAWAALSVHDPVTQIVCGGFGAFVGLTAIGQWRKDEEQLRRWIDANTPSGTFGNAAFMTPAQADAAGLYDPRGLYLGTLGGAPIFHSGKAHGLTVAPARSGKGISFVIPNLLHYQGSVFVTDPKGELAAVTARHRAQTFAQKVRVLNPWGLHGLPQDRFNPLGYLVAMHDDPAQRRGLTEEVAALALQLVAEPEGGDKNFFFREGSRKLLRAFLLHFASRGRPDACTLPDLWRVLQSAVRMDATLADMAVSDALGGVVADLADDIIRTLDGAKETVQSFVEGATQAVSIFDPSGWLADSVTGSDCTFEELKAGRVTVYVVIPSDRIATHGAWLGLLTRQAISAVARAPGKSPVLFMLDEFANMGKLAGLSESLTLLPGLGVRVWMIVQALDQLRAVYGRETANTIRSQAEVQQYFAVQDQNLAKELSDAAGQRTVKATSFNLGRKEGDDAGESRSEVGRPLLSPDQIRQLPVSEQLLFIQSLPPIRCARVSFWQVAPWQTWAEPNPVEGGYPTPQPDFTLNYKRQ